MGKLSSLLVLHRKKKHIGRWFVYQPDSISRIVEDIIIFLERWTIPFLDVYATPNDILATDERNDGRLPRDRAQILRVVAAALACNRRDSALAIMERWFDSPGLRRRYQQVYDFIESKV